MIIARAVGPLRAQITHSTRRSYATSSPGRSNTPLYAALAVGLGLAGWYITSNGDVEKVEEKVKSLVAEKKASDEGLGALGVLIKDAWTPFTLEKVEPYNHNSKIYTFSFGEEGKQKISGGQVASALLVKTPEGDEEVKDDKGKPVIRPYTPISPPDLKGSLTLLVKEYKDGKLTPYISSMVPGKDKLLFKGPIPKYKYEPNTFDQGLCIAGGSGITPMWQLISHAMEIPGDRTKFTLIFSNVTPKDILLKEKWDQLAKDHPDRLQVKYVVDKSEKGWSGETGFVTAPLISKLFKRQDGEKVMAFVCGPPPQVNSLAGPKDGPRQGELKGALKELGYNSDEVYKF
ncbi:hypothetical protein BCR39DRAFT_494109 [Naematelia encephala]|uniref:cytochrome-b5 reductase n=1 Tax=Naematelia encephala TaxID=71784 RepID=A0A1Y2B8Z2_9TREE|nr:hypothetical protein BCR39DRAFT_494109 [Naematelia encephala]